MSQPPDFDAANQAALEELADAIELGLGKFFFFVVRCDYASLRSQMVARLQALCPVDFRIITLSPTTPNLYTAVQSEFADEQPEAVMVLGLEHIQLLDPVMVATDLAREEFRKHCPFPLVLWVDEVGFKALKRKASNLASWAGSATVLRWSTETLLASLHQGADALLKAVLAPDSPLSFRKQMARSPLGLVQRCELKMALQDLCDRQVDLCPDLQASLALVQGVDAERPDDALQYFQQSLTVWQAALEAGEPGADLPQTLLKTALAHYLVGYALYWIGDRLKHQASMWEEARPFLERSIALFDQAERPDLVAKCITMLERTLHRMEDWQSLEAIAQRGVHLHQHYSNPNKLAQDYGFLAEVALHDSRWDEAQQWAKTALDLLRQDTRTEHWAEGLYLLLLAQAHHGAGRWAPAIAYLQQAVKLGDRGHPLLYIRIAEALRGLYRQQGHYLEAFKLKQSQLAVEQQYGIRAFVGPGRLQEKRMSTTPAEAALASEVPPEIRVSTRQRDLRQLLERIGRNDCKLIVIHGFSGVGKSSLVYAALLPTLQKQTIGTRENVPLLMRTYTNWLEDLRSLLMEVSHASFAHADAPAEPQMLVDQIRYLSEHKRVVLIFDQFEEFFFATPDPLKRQEFFNFLVDCLQILSLKVVLSLREDYIHYLLEFNRLPRMAVTEQDLLSRHVLYRLGDFSTDETKAIINALTERSRFYLEPALVDALVCDLAGPLGEVRPIELQVIGTQLQTEGIKTLSQYQELGDQPKEELIRRYLMEVIEDCGPENQSIAAMVLYLLTDERGTRPLKTQPELERELESLSLEPSEAIAPRQLLRHQLDLILRILCGAGLVTYLPERPDDRYQLVHDYIAAFVRQQQGPQLERLAAELQQERQQRQALERQQRQIEQDLKQVEHIKQTLQRELQQVQTELDAVTAKRDRILADVQTAQLQLEAAEAARAEAIATSEIETLGLGALRQFEFSQLDALLNAVRAGRRLQTQIARSPHPHYLALSPVVALQRILENIHEKNRLQGYQEWVGCLCFHPDQSYLITGDGMGVVTWWDLQGHQLAKFAAHLGTIKGIDFSPDGQCWVTADSNGKVKIWNLQQQVLHEFQAHDRGINNAKFSPQGDYLATASEDGTAKLWDRQGNLVTVFAGHHHWVNNLAFSPDGHCLATAASDTLVRLWDLSGNCLTTLEGHQKWVNSVCFSPDGETLATASRDGSIRLWNQHGSLIDCFHVHQGGVYDVQFSPDGQWLALGLDDGTTRIWDRQGHQMSQLQGHTSFVRRLQFSPDGQTLATVSVDRTVRIWSPFQGHTSNLHRHPDLVNDACFSPDGQTIATASADNLVRVWDRQGHVLASLAGHRKRVWSVAFSPNGYLLASSSTDCTVKLWDLENRVLLQDLIGHQKWIKRVCFSPDGQVLATASGDATVRLWRITGECITVLQHQDAVWDVSFSPDGKSLVSAAADGRVRLCSSEGEMLLEFQAHAKRISSVRFSPDGQALATASADGFAKLWDLKGHCLAELQGHQGEIWDVCFSPTGELLATASVDRTAKVWNLQGNPITEFREHHDMVYSVRFSPDGQYLVTTSADRTLRCQKIETLDQLLERGCEWLQDYLQSSPDVTDGDRALCQCPQPSGE